MTTTSATPTTLTERYVHATLREVPQGRRADLGQELRSTIADMVEARVADGQSSDEAERQTLAELGDPAALAARYTGAPMQLLGPRFYLVWKRLTLQLLLWVPALVGMLVAAVRVIDGDGTVGQVLVDAGGAAIGTAVQLVFWTTLVFVVLDRVVAEDPAEWTPDHLPEGPREREYTFGDAASSIGWTLVVAAVLVLQHFRSWVAGADGEDRAVLDPDLWSGWLPFLLAVLAVSVVVEVWKYARGWTLGAVVATVVTSLAFCVPVVWLATQDRLVNPDFVDAVGLGASGLDNLNTAIAVSAVLVAAWEVVEAVVKGVLRRRRAD